ncbi:MAG TPA: hypothetical protein VHY81_01725, partial [Acidimicrobiales bacterium]|nr:hypothetical protein [Acidimicrobiales bacterium]
MTLEVDPWFGDDALKAGEDLEQEPALEADHLLGQLETEVHKANWLADRNREGCSHQVRERAKGCGDSLFARGLT